MTAYYVHMILNIFNVLFYLLGYFEALTFMAFTFCIAFFTMYLLKDRSLKKLEKVMEKQDKIINEHYIILKKHNRKIKRNGV